MPKVIRKEERREKTHQKNSPEEFTSIPFMTDSAELLHLIDFETFQGRLTLITQFSTGHCDLNNHIDNQYQHKKYSWPVQTTLWWNTQ